MNASRIALGLSSALAIAACSSAKVSGTTTEIMPAEPADAAAPVVDAAHDTSSPVVTPPAKDAAPEAPAGECSTEATQTACLTCCSNKHMDGSGAYFVALIDCMCVADNCAKDCAKTLCDPNNPQNADAQCQSCVQAKNSACAATIKSACQADADCVLFDACIGKSDCAGKTN